jgi:type IX secretion system PorP/SprF family membrane protein
MRVMKRHVYPVKIMLLTLYAIFFFQGIHGQLAPVTDQYILNPQTMNPAYSGSRGALTMAAFYRRQWVGLKGAPETLTLAADAPMKEGRVGIGLNISTDKIGVTRESSFNTNYSYTVVAGDGKLSLGLGAGLLATNTKWSELTVLDPGDDLYLVDSKVFVVPDFSFGIYYTQKNYFAAASIPRLLQYKFNFDKNRYSLKANAGKYNYLFHTGYLFDIGEKSKFLPSVFLSISPGNKLLFDLNAHFGIYDRMWVGASYRSNKSTAILFQFMINNQLKAAYSYYFDFNRLGNYNNGSHEIMLRYQFLFKADVVNPLIF